MSILFEGCYDTDKFEMKGPSLVGQYGRLVFWTFVNYKLPATGQQCPAGLKAFSYVTILFGSQERLNRLIK